MNRDALKQLLIRHEGIRLFPYRDSVGKLTIGVGRNIDDNGISKEEALVMLDNDLARVVSECRENFPWFNGLCDSRQNVIASMCFNMGLTRLKGFTRMLAAIAARDFDTAANEMLASMWAAQVKSRAVELAEMMRNGDTIH